MSLLYVFRHSPNCVLVVIRVFWNLFAKSVNGGTLIFSFDISKSTSPGVSNILSLIVSRFSSRYLRRDVLFVVYIAVIYQVCPVGTLLVVSFHTLETISILPSCFVVNTCSLAFNDVLTLSFISSSFSVVGNMVISPLVFIAPSVFVMLSGSFIFMPFIVVVSFGGKG